MDAVAALRRKQYHSTRNAMRRFGQQSLLKVVFIFLFVILCEASLWHMFQEGFRFLNRQQMAGTFLIRKLFSLFFMGISAMLVLSSAVTSYAALYRSKDVTFLLTRPITTAQIALHKFFETARLSSWAFFFVVLPFVGAYAYHQKDSLMVLAWTLVYSIPLLFICSGVGSLLTLVTVRWAPARKDAGAIFITGCLVLIGLGWLLSSSSPQEDDSVFSLVNQIPGMRLASHPLLPSAWVSDGIAAAAAGRWEIAGNSILLLGVNMLFVLMLIEWAGESWYYKGWLKVGGASANQKRSKRLMGFMDHPCPFVSSQAQAIATKDIRSFLRDPMQWSQALIFFGLLALYFANLRNLNYHNQLLHWRNAIAFLNVFSMSAVMCSLGARFLYPQLSLEGHSFWILGLSPTKRRTLLMTKFCVSAISLTMISLTLTLLSTSMLDASGAIRIIALGLAVSTSLAIAGLSIGLGAVFLDLRETNPAVILSGFGGTLNLILSLVYMLGSTLPFCIIYNLFALHRLTTEQAITAFSFCIVWLILLTLCATVIPLRIGHNMLVNRDF